MTEYHVRRKEKEISESGEMLGVLRRGRFASIAMCRGGEPYVVTMNYGFDEERGALFFHCARTGHKLEFLDANARVCATVVEDLGYKTGRCDHRYRSVVLRGELRRVGGLEEKRHGIEMMLRHLEEDPDPVRERALSKEGVWDTFEVLRLDIESMTGKQGL